MKHNFMKQKSKRTKLESTMYLVNKLLVLSKFICSLLNTRVEYINFLKATNAKSVHKGDN